MRRMSGALEVCPGFIPDFQIPSQPEGGADRGQPVHCCCGSLGCQGLWRSPGHQEGNTHIRRLAQRRDPHIDFFVGSSWYMFINGCHNVCGGTVQGSEFQSQRVVREATKHRLWMGNQKSTLALFPCTTSVKIFFSTTKSHCQYLIIITNFHVILISRK